MAAAAAELLPDVAELETSLSRPPRLGYLWEPRIERVLLDLAIQTAGAVSVPLQETPGETPGERPPHDHRVEPPAALDLDRPAPGGESAPAAGRDAADRDATGRDAADYGGACVRDPKGRLQSLRMDELVARAAGLELASRLEASSAGRAIWVSGRPLWDPVERLVFAAALSAGAAVVLASPETHVPTAAWARPTVFSGDAAEVTALVQAARTYRPPVSQRWTRWLRTRLLRRDLPPVPPFDRLRTVLVRTEEAQGEGEGPTAGLPQEVSGFLHDRGVELVSLPVHLDAALWRRSYNIELRGGQRGGSR